MADPEDDVLDPAVGERIADSQYEVVDPEPAPSDPDDEEVSAT